jgi:hypothetical protein
MHILRENSWPSRTPNTMKRITNLFYFKNIVQYHLTTLNFILTKQKQKEEQQKILKIMAQKYEEERNWNEPIEILNMSLSYRAKNPHYEPKPFKGSKIDELNYWEMPPLPEPLPMEGLVGKAAPFDRPVKPSFYWLLKKIVRKAFSKTLHQDCMVR